MTNSWYRGQCLCGEVEYIARGEPIWTGYCHCQSCRRHTGSAVASFAGYRPGCVELTKSPPRKYQSSPGVSRRFCDRCGTPISYEADRFPNEIHLFVGTMDEPEKFSPQFHVFCAEQISWLEVNDALPRYEHQSNSNS